MRTLPLPCVSSSLHIHTNNTFGFFSPPSSSSFIFTPSHHKRIHFITPCSSLKQTKKQRQQLSKINTAPSGIRRLFSPKSDDGDNKNENEPDSDSEDGTALKGTLLAGVLLIGIVGGFAFVGYIYRDPINSFLNQLSAFIEGFLSLFYFNPNSLLPVLCFSLSDRVCLGKQLDKGLFG